METNVLTSEERKMRALWFARTLHENKIRIQSGQARMDKQDYDNDWENIVNEFIQKRNVLL